MDREYVKDRRRKKLKRDKERRAKRGKKSNRPRKSWDEEYGDVSEG